HSYLSPNETATQVVLAGCRQELQWVYVASRGLSRTQSLPQKTATDYPRLDLITQQRRGLFSTPAQLCFITTCNSARPRQLTKQALIML
ncbi:unnamed protein product, partial [Linum tenue]